jgi:hypothetical protein
MIIISIVVTLVFVLVALIVVMAARGRAPAAYGIEELNRHIREVNVFELLTLADEFSQLRQNSEPDARVKQHYRVIRLQLLEHIRVIAINAAIVLRIAQFARHQREERAANLAQKLINDALSVRLLAFALVWRLHTLWLFPRLTFKPGGVIFFYERLLEHLGGLFLGMQSPVVTSSR